MATKTPARKTRPTPEEIEAAVSQLQALVQTRVPARESLVDELIADRRREANA